MPTAFQRSPVPMQPTMGRSLGLSQLKARWETPVYQMGMEPVARAPALRKPRRDNGRDTEHPFLGETVREV